MEEAACQLEKDHVHTVYERIAPFFNDSRYKAWPKVSQFLLEQEPGSIVADIGCGNGKYLHINANIFKLGSDVCQPLVESARGHGHEVQICNGLRLPYRNGCFDAILSIAVIHHFSTKARRIRAIKEMARTLRRGGRMMIYVWAMEQKRRKFEKQDIFVPWNPDPPPNLVDGQTLRKCGAETDGPHPQGECDGVDTHDKHKRGRSTSSTLEETEPPVSSSLFKKHRLWFFSRSLDSSLEFGSLTVSGSKELEADQSLAKERDSDREGTRGRERNFLSCLLSSTNSLHGDPPGSVLNWNSHQPKDRNSSHESTQSITLVQECSASPLPDLVIDQHNESEGVTPGPQGQNSDSYLLHKSGDNAKEARTYCDVDGGNKLMRYYHVFREGELGELIEKHVEELRILHTYFDHANWCVIAEKVMN